MVYKANQGSNQWKVTPPPHHLHTPSIPSLRSPFCSAVCHMCVNRLVCSGRRVTLPASLLHCSTASVHRVAPIDNVRSCWAMHRTTAAWAPSPAAVCANPCDKVPFLCCEVAFCTICAITANRAYIQRTKGVMNDRCDDCLIWSAAAHAQQHNTHCQHTTAAVTHCTPLPHSHPASLLSTAVCDA